MLFGILVGVGLQITHYGNLAAFMEPRDTLFCQLAMGLYMDEVRLPEAVLVAIVTGDCQLELGHRLACTGIDAQFQIVGDVSDCDDFQHKLISFFDGRVDRDDGWGITSLKGEGKEKHLTKGAGGRDERCLDPDWCWWYTL